MATERNNAEFEAGMKVPLVEEFYTLQGEGYHTGHAAYFIRIGGCDVGCSWCDTKFSWNPELHPPVEIEAIAERAAEFPAGAVVVTGGEPLMVNMAPLTAALKERGISTFLETSGAYPLTGEWDWICLSPKRNSTGGRYSSESPRTESHHYISGGPGLGCGAFRTGIR